MRLCVDEIGVCVVWWLCANVSTWVLYRGIREGGGVLLPQQEPEKRTGACLQLRQQCVGMASGDHVMPAHNMWPFANLQHNMPLCAQPYQPGRRNHDESNHLPDQYAFTHVPHRTEGHSQVGHPSSPPPVWHSCEHLCCCVVRSTRTQRGEGCA